MSNKQIKIGAASDNDIVKNEKHVSSYHAILTENNGVFTIRDLHSTNGIYVNNRKISETVLHPGDKITLGLSVPLNLDKIIRNSTKVEHHRNGQQGNASGTSVTIGRKSDNDIVILNPGVSEHHAIIEQTSFGGWQIRDLNSLNGTYINGKRISSPESFILGLDISLGNTKFNAAKYPVIMQFLGLGGGGGSNGNKTKNDDETGEYYYPEPEIELKFRPGSTMMLYGFMMTLGILVWVVLGIFQYLFVSKILPEYLLLISIFYFLLLFLYFILSSLLIHRGWKAVDDGCSQTTPAKVLGFLFIPLFNLYWYFVAYGSLADEWDRVYQDNPYLSPKMLKLVAPFKVGSIIIAFIGVVAAGIILAKTGYEHPAGILLIVFNILGIIVSFSSTIIWFIAGYQLTRALEELVTEE